MKKQRDEGAEENFKKMRWPCKSCELSDDPSRNQNFMKPFQDFGVRCPADFITKLLPQGAWARCSSCQDERRGVLGKKYGEMGKEYGEMGKEYGEMGKELGGNTNNARIKERSLTASQACETCKQCSRSLTCEHFWPEDWRHRTDRGIGCKECCPKPPKKRLTGYMAKNEQRVIEASARPITCQACKRALPRTQFQPNSSRGTFDARRPQTCHQCRAEGKHVGVGRKRRRVE